MTGMVGFRLFRFLILIFLYLWFGYLLFAQGGDVVLDKRRLDRELVSDSLNFVSYHRSRLFDLGLVGGSGYGISFGMELSRGYLRLIPRVNVSFGGDSSKFVSDIGIGLRYRNDNDRGVIFGSIPGLGFSVGDGGFKINFKLNIEAGFHYRYRALRASFVRKHYGRLRGRLEGYEGKDKLLRSTVLDIRERRELRKCEGGFRLLGSFLVDVLDLNYNSNFVQFRLGVLF
jgi:hypothetical protein